MASTTSMKPVQRSNVPVRKLRVLLVDDHELVRFGTARLIEAEGDLEVCGEAEDAAAACELVRSTSPNLAIIDLSLRSGSGLDVVRAIRDGFPWVQTIVCSAHDERLYAPRALRAGARGYVSKQQSAQTLVGAIRKVLEGKLALSPKMTEQIVQRAAGISGPDASTPLESLSDRELQVFELIGEGATVSEIARRLSISPKTVEFHRARIREKLGVATNALLLRHAFAWVVERGTSIS